MSHTYGVQYKALPSFGSSSECSRHPAVPSERGRCIAHSVGLPMFPPIPAPRLDSEPHNAAWLRGAFQSPTATAGGWVGKSRGGRANDGRNLWRYFPSPGPLRVQARRAPHLVRGTVAVAPGPRLLERFFSLGGAGQPLNVFQRVLLTTDGTVTDVLEAYVSEAIRVVKLAQGFTCCLTEPSDMALGNERVLRRTVLLQGTISGTNFIHCDSVVIAERLPAPVLAGLLTTGKPIGKLLAENRVETFREIVDLGFEPAAGCASHFGVATETPLVFRTYRIHHGQRPVMCITEKFPMAWFEDRMKP